MDKFLIAAKWLLARAKEPSSWAGTGVVAVILTQFLPPDLANAVLNVGATFGAVLAIVLPEKSV